VNVDRTRSRGLSTTVRRHNVENGHRHRLRLTDEPDGVKGTVVSAYRCGHARRRLLTVINTLAGIAARALHLRSHVLLRMNLNNTTNTTTTTSLLSINSPFEVFAYFLFAYIVRQVSDPKMASLPNHYVANSSSFGNTPKHTRRVQRFHCGPTDSETTHTHTFNQIHTHRHRGTLARARPRQERRLGNAAATTTTAEMKNKKCTLRKHRDRMRALSGNDIRARSTAAGYTLTDSQMRIARQHQIALGYFTSTRPFWVTEK